MSQILTIEKLRRITINDHPFLQELVRQILVHNPSQLEWNSSQELPIDFFILSSIPPKSLLKKEREILIKLKISAFYHAVAVSIEKQTGHLAQTFINLNTKKLSSALVFCGGVLVVGQIIREVESFGFNSIESLINEAERLIQTAVAIAHQYLDIASTELTHFPAI